MTNRDKLVEIMLRYPRALCDHCGDDNWLEANAQQFADHLLSNVVAFQTTPITYERLLEIARKMHCWIFLNVGDEQEVYDEMGLTDEENAVLGYSGQMVISTNERC